MAVLMLALLVLFTATACLGLDEESYSSQAKKVANTLDTSVALINKDDMNLLNANPDRGLRMENYITLGNPLYSYPGNEQDPYERATEMFEKYSSDSPTLSQVYVYLTNYYNKPLDELALSQMKSYFELYKKNNIRMLLRFTYSTEKFKNQDATYNIMSKHIAQIKSFFESNKQLMTDTLYCLQLGMIGYWGEGHSYINFDYKKDVKKLITDMFTLVDDEMYLQVRTMDIYKKVPLKFRKQTGMHDDYVIDDPKDKWAFLPSNRINYKSTMKKFSTTINDGEMPWGVATLGDVEGAAPLNKMDGKKIMKRMYDHSFTSFSLEHNYREKDDGSKFTMENWKLDLLTYDEAAKLGISVNPHLFDLNGGKMSIYDIVRYHLGYQLALSNLQSNGDITSFTISNYGWAAPLKMNYLALVVEEDGVLKEHKIDAYNKEKLQSNTTIKYFVRLPENAKVVGVRLAINEKSNYSVRFANATNYINGVQYFN